MSISKLLCPAFKRISLRTKKEKERQNEDKLRKWEMRIGSKLKCLIIKSRDQF
jgi:hypothetical protein